MLINHDVGSVEEAWMTPFMLEVAELLELEIDVDRPELRLSEPRNPAIGAETHIESRCLAEQLVCEANAVLASNGRERVVLVDEAMPGALSFRLSCQGRNAHVVTDIGRKTATGHLFGFGARQLSNVELRGAEELERLILLLIAGRCEDAVPLAGTN